MVAGGFFTFVVVAMPRGMVTFTKESEVLCWTQVDRVESVCRGEVLDPGNIGCTTRCGGHGGSMANCDEWKRGEEGNDWDRGRIREEREWRRGERKVSSPQIHADDRFLPAHSQSKPRSAQDD